MYCVRIEHDVKSYEGWKKLFDGDPIDRRKMGVRSYRILRQVGNAGHVIVELDFELLDQATATETALKALWGRVEGNVMSNATIGVHEIAETKSL